MKTSPITKIAGTNYGSAPVTEEVTKDAAGKTPAKFERMQPVAAAKQTGPIEEDVQDDTGNLQIGKVTYEWGPDGVKVNPGKIIKASKERCGIEVDWSDPRCKAYSNMSDEEIKQSEINQGLRTPDTTSRTPGELLAQFAFQPKEQTVDTNEIRERRQNKRIILGGARTATSKGNRADRVTDRYEKVKKKREDAGLSEDQASNREKRLKRKSENLTKAANALQANFDKDVALMEAGVNFYSTGRKTINQKAPDGTQTIQEFKDKYNLTPGSRDTTPGNIKFYTTPSGNPTPSSTGGTERQDQNFYDLFDQNNKSKLGSGFPKKASSPIYKMGGYGSKSYK